ncbi:hypothetical protein B6N60_00877 [Richelia sinica FACHB-800]|uniref:Uncharacterized protein n=1 Tax=Richelia sinica FACHB-800 TaxID=1357546 RepID=A0A975T6A7_9NOST|nr:hypothetical protein B6N60_00877 [Richelia sinica FACHB-800]
MKIPFHHLLSFDIQDLGFYSHSLTNPAYLNAETRNPEINE